MLRTPDGAVVRDEAAYSEAWRALANPLEDALGWKLCAWDPDYMFAGPEKQLIYLGVSEVRAIAGLVARLAACERVVAASRAFVLVMGADSMALSSPQERRFDDLDEAIFSLDEEGRE